MGIIFFGVKETPIGYNEYLIKCPSCESESWADAMVISKYYHFYFVPICPLGKEVNIVCKKCGLKRFALAFDKNLISNFEEVKKFRHPWFTYTGLFLFIFLMLSILIF